MCRRCCVWGVSLSPCNAVCAHCIHQLWRAVSVSGDERGMRLSTPPLVHLCCSFNKQPRGVCVHPIGVCVCDGAAERLCGWWWGWLCCCDGWMLTSRRTTRIVSAVLISSLAVLSARLRVSHSLLTTTRTSATGVSCPARARSCNNACCEGSPGVRASTLSTKYCGCVVNSSSGIVGKYICEGIYENHLCVEPTFPWCVA